MTLPPQQRCDVLSTSFEGMEGLRAELSLVRWCRVRHGWEMTDDFVVHRHDPRQMTVGEPRAALDGVPDETTSTLDWPHPPLSRRRAGHRGSGRDDRLRTPREG